MGVRTEPGCSLTLTLYNCRSENAHPTPERRIDIPPAPQVASKDKDFRYMAASDLQGELAKDGFQVEGDSERRLVQVVLQQLEDPSGDIQNLAVKWCPPILILLSVCSVAMRDPRRQP